MDSSLIGYLEMPAEVYPPSESLMCVCVPLCAFVGVGTCLWCLCEYVCMYVCVLCVKMCLCVSVSVRSCRYKANTTT